MNHAQRYQSLSVSLRSDLIAELKRHAHQRGTAIDLVLNEALQSYLRQFSHHRAITTPIDANIFAAGASPTQHPLYLSFNNKLHIINKPRFVIGRDRDSDLCINDSNISRHHCEVIYQDGEYKIFDLQSTNGVEFKGQRVHWRHITEGDEFFLCEFKISFTYEQP